MNDLDFIDIGEDRGETEMRLLQKIEFGKIIFPIDFFNKEKISETDIEVLNVFQLDPNTRYTIIKDTLLKITAENTLYNYIDKGRKVVVDVYNRYDNDNEDKADRLYIFNDLDICERNLKLFDDFGDMTDIKFKKLGVINEWHIYLVFKEEIDIIKTRIKEEIKTKNLEQEIKKQNEIEEEQKQKELEEKLGTITKDTKLEDKNIIICGNYLIDKERGIKIEFKKPLCEIFTKKELINSYSNADNFIIFDYGDIINKLESLFETGKYEKTIEEKYAEFINTLNKHLLNFKVYSYNKETKEEKFIKDFKISIDKGKTGKGHFYINDIQIPKQKIKFLLRFLQGRGRYTYENSGEYTLISRYRELENNVENHKYYSGTQLYFLQGKEFEVDYKDKEIRLFFDIKNPDIKKDIWQVKFGNLTLNKSYSEIKDIYNHFGNRSGHIAGQISNICECLNCEQLEDEIIKHINLVLEQIKLAEIKAKTLFLDFITKNKALIIPKDNFYIIKGKLKTYKLVAEKNQAKAWTYPTNNYVCINEQDRGGHELCIWDKLLQFAMALLNDSKMREEISTLH